MERFFKRVQIDCSKGGRTKQEFKDDVDINRIIARYRKSGQLTGQFRAPGSGLNLNVSSAVDFKTATNIVLRGKQQFGSLSADVRKFFDNDPEKFLAFMADEKNLDKAIELKLVNPKKVPDGPLKVEVVNPQPPADDKK